MLSGSTLLALKVRDLCRLPALSVGPSGNPIWNYAGSRTRISWKVVDELLALSRISWKVVDELLALSALKV